MSFLRRLFGSRDDQPEPPTSPAMPNPAWAAAGEGPFDVEKIPGEWHFQITFDDEIAHEEEDRVQAFIDRLPAERGVDRAVHEDREVVLVKAKGLSQAEMQAISERVWSSLGGEERDE